jgi:hypothetical protein
MLVTKKDLLVVAGAAAVTAALTAVVLWVVLL